MGLTQSESNVEDINLGMEDSVLKESKVLCIVLYKVFLIIMLLDPCSYKMGTNSVHTPVYTTYAKLS